MNSHDKYVQLFGKVAKFSEFVGCNMIKENYKPNLITVFSISLGIAALFQCVMTQVIVFGQGKFLLGCSVFAYYGICIQALAKFYYAYINKHHVRQLYERLRLLHKDNQTDLLRREVLNVIVDRCTLVFYGFLVVYTGAYIVFCSYPILAQIFFAQRVLSLEVYLPYIDPYSDSGYIITMAYHFVILTMAVTGILASDMNFMVVCAHYTVLIDLFEISIREFTIELRQTPGDQNGKIKEKLREIVMEHQRMIDLMNCQDETYTNMVFIQACCTNSTIVACLFVCTFQFWVPGYGLALGNLVQFLTYQTFGTLIEMSNDRALVDINEIPYYLLGKERSQEYRFLIMKAQSPNMISLAGLAPLSVATAKEVINKIYSFYMMAMTFLEDMSFE